MIKIPFLKMFSLLIILALLTGCASTVKPVSKSAIENKTFVLIPTGKVNYQVGSDKGGASFGLIGALIENLATASSRDTSATRLSTEVPPEFLLKTATNELETELKKYGNYKLEVSNNHTLKESPYSEWSKASTRPDLKELSKIKGDVIVDVGVANLMVYQKFSSNAVASISISIRFIDKSNGVIHGEAREVSDSASFIMDEDSSEYSSQVKKVFEKLVRQSVDKSLAKIFAVQTP